MRGGLMGEGMAYYGPRINKVECSTQLKSLWEDAYALLVELEQAVEDELEVENEHESESY
jgi:hypothetical protein